MRKVVYRNEKYIYIDREYIIQRLNRDNLQYPKPPTKANAIKKGLPYSTQPPKFKQHEHKLLIKTRAKQASIPLNSLTKRRTPQMGD